MNVAYERREDPIKLKEIFITWGPTERKESGVWWRNRQEGKAELDDVWGGQREGVPSCYRATCFSRPSSDRHLSSVA